MIVDPQCIDYHSFSLDRQILQLSTHSPCKTMTTVALSFCGTRKGAWGLDVSVLVRFRHSYVSFVLHFHSSPSITYYHRHRQWAIWSLKLHLWDWCILWWSFWPWMQHMSTTRLPPSFCSFIFVWWDWVEPVGMGIDICMILVIPPLEDRTPSLISITSLIGPHLFAYSKQDGDAFSTYPHGSITPSGLEISCSSYMLAYASRIHHHTKQLRICVPSGRFDPVFVCLVGHFFLHDAWAIAQRCYIPFTSELAVEVVSSSPDPNFLHSLRVVNLPFCNLSTPLILLLWLDPMAITQPCAPGSYDTNATM